MLRSSPGLTLFEAMVSLAIMALVLGVVAATMRGPSPALQLRNEVAKLQSDAATRRITAITRATTVIWDVPEADCDTGAPATLRFYPDGTLSGPLLCLRKDGAALQLAPQPLNGTLIPVSGP